MPLRGRDLQAEWFQAYNCEARNIAETICQIENNVALFDLGSHIKEVCVQLVPGTRCYQGDRIIQDFLLYVGIAGSPKKFLPPKVKELPPFMYGGTACSVEDVLPIFEDWRRKNEGKVLYRAPDQVFTFSPGSDGDEAVVEARSADEILSDTRQYDRLLTLLAAHGSGDYRQFALLCQALFPNRIDIKPPQVRKRFRLLGHIAESPDGAKWRVLPPLLVPAIGPDDSVEYTIIGARDAMLRAALREAITETGGTLREETQPLGDGPSAWYATTPLEPEEMRHVAQKIGATVCDDYAACVNGLPDIHGYRTALPVTTVGDTHYYDFRLFDGTQTFQSCRFDHAEGLYELWGQPDAPGGAKRERAVYFDKIDRCWRSGDWYGLRFLHRRSRGDSVCLMHRAGATGDTELLCPDAYRLPERYEQALIISSGKLPTVRQSDRGNRKRVFTNIPCPIAEIVAAKIDAQLMR